MFSKVTNMFDNPVLATYVRILPQTWYGWMSMRAGLLLCERPCIDHKLDYPMTDSLLSITRGVTALELSTPHYPHLVPIFSLVFIMPTVGTTVKYHPACRSWLGGALGRWNI
jgi:hypothetical protein